MSIKDFDQRGLQDVLVKLSGKGLSAVSSEVSHKVNDQLDTVKNSIISFKDILSNMDGINNNVRSIYSNMDELIDTTNECSSQLSLVSDRMGTLDNQFSSVGGLLKTINAISDQTNLLALNATIEAARAGEVGKGFAVVATEVKELSRNTKRVNTEIQQTLIGISNSIEDLSKNVKLTIEKMESSLKTVAVAQSCFSNINSETEQFNKKINKSLGDFTKLDGMSSVVSNQMKELGTIGDTFKFLLELINMLKINIAPINPLERLGPVVEASTFKDMARFTKTSEEYILNSDDILISATDTRGIITFANNKFYEVAEYPEGSLLGQPHNIVRHPDMPKTAFADLWNVIKTGKLWQGYVCNIGRRGRIYWVKATVFPCYQNGEIIGYLSLREKPELEKVEVAKKAYRLVE